MSWKKLGQIFVPDNKFEWMVSHAANVVAQNIENNIFKIYFSTRDKNNISSIGYIITELTDTMKVLEIGHNPVLRPGGIGLFDDSGVSLSCIATIQDRTFLYYLGWNLGVTVPWRNSIGLAILNKTTNEFEKHSPAPLLDRSRIDPYSISYPFVLVEQDKIRMWYGSNLSWGKSQTDMAHVIKYAESDDGINWVRNGEISLKFKDSSEYAMSRPYVIYENGLYKMWYSYRGNAYRIGYAESMDGVNFERKDDQVGIEPSKTGWDSDTIEYPFLFSHQGKRYMLYNGNNYGKTGFGIAIQDKI